MAENKINKFKSFPAVATATSGPAKEAFPNTPGFHRKGIHIHNPDASNSVLVYFPDDLVTVPIVAGTDAKDIPDYKIPAGTTLEVECNAQSKVYLGASGGAITVIPKEIY
jgi:hypothetical protein